MSEEILHRKGVYGWLRIPQASIFLPLPDEDFGKKEIVIGNVSYEPLVAGMLGIISGGEEENEQADLALRRELYEERQISSNALITNSLPSVTVGQHREGRRVSFEVSGHMFHVTEALRWSLLMRTPTVEIPDTGLPDFLRENKHRLRPFVYAVARELLVSGQLYRL